MGADRERELTKWLYDEGFGALRIGSSGSGTTRPLPDVFAYAHGSALAIEEKDTSKDYIHFPETEVKLLCDFCSRWDAIPLLVGRFTYDTTWYVKTVSDDDGLSDSMSRGKTDEYQTMRNYLELDP